MMFDLCYIDWNSIAAIVSLIMVVLTGISLIHNRKQLQEIKRQWKEQNSPKLSCSLEKRSDSLILEIKNSSQVVAHGVSIRVENHTNEKIFRFDETNELLSKMTFEIHPFGIKQIPLWITPFVDGDYDGYISVLISQGSKEELFKLYLKEINLIIEQYTTRDLCNRIGRIEGSIKNLK